MRFQKWEIGCWGDLEINSQRWGKIDNSVIGYTFNHRCNNKQRGAILTLLKRTMKGPHFTFLSIWWIALFFPFPCGHVLSTCYVPGILLILSTEVPTHHCCVTHTAKWCDHMRQVTHNDRSAQRKGPCLWPGKGKVDRDVFLEQLMLDLDPEGWVEESPSCAGQKRGGSLRGQRVWSSEGLLSY